nr:hypothetical protein [Tolypothrix sp. FACHB-123]
MLLVETYPSSDRKSIIKSILTKARSPYLVHQAIAFLILLLLAHSIVTHLPHERRMKT